MTAPVVPPEHKENAIVVAVAPLKDAAVVAVLVSGGQRRGGRLGATLWWSRQSGGEWLVVRLADGATAAAHNVAPIVKGDLRPAPCCGGCRGRPRFEGSVAVVVAKTPAQGRGTSTAAHMRPRYLSAVRERPQYLGASPAPCYVTFGAARTRTQYLSAAHARP
jgi:hypothetical protein